MEEPEKQSPETPENQLNNTKAKQTKQRHNSSETAKQQDIWSWGAGTEGQLATGKLEDEYTPQHLHNLTNSLSLFGSISFISCGGAHVIALSSGGKVLTWGRGSSGQLGHGQVVANCLSPKLVDGLSKFNICHVSAGWNHSSFVSDSGCLFTCGDGSFGQLGHGDNQSYSSPMEVSFFSSMHVEQVACGMRHTLVLTRGSLGDQLYGFGSGKRGQLGISKEKVKSLSVPQLCSGLEGAQVITITANGDHSAALSTDGHIYTWGRNFNGGSDVHLPESLQSPLRFKEAALGWNHALLLTGEGEAFMLGGSHHGVLSEPEKMSHVHNSSGKPQLFKVTHVEGEKVVQIAAGAEHSAIVIEDGKVCTWGWGEHGQLGLGNTNDRTSPQMVDLPNAYNVQNFMPCVYCGSGFTFALNTKRTPSDQHH